MRSLVVLGLVVSALIAARPAPAQEAQRVVVTDVQFRGLVSMSPEFVQSKIKTRVGEPVAAATVADDVQRLHKLNLLCERVEQTPFDNGVRLTFIINESPTVLAVEFDIAPGARVRRNELRKDIRLKPGEHATHYALRLDETRLRDYLLGKGYPYAQVQTTTTPVPGKGVNITFQVNAGPRMQPERITLVGNASIPRKELVKIMQTREDK